MQTLLTILPYVQIALAVILTTLVLIQQRGAGVGGALGGGDGNFGYNTRRGAEKVIFYLCIIVALLFVASALVSLIIK